MENKLNIGIRLHDTISGSLEEKLDYIKEQGFTCVHLALSKAIEDIKITNEMLTPGFAMYLKREFAKRDLDIAVLGCYLNLLHPDPEELANIQDTYKAHIRFASILGCGVVGTETGCPNKEYKFVEACRSKETLEQFIHNLRPVVEYAEKMGVIIAIEPVAVHTVCTSKRARQVLDTIYSPNLQIILDPVNLISKDNYHEAPQIISEAIELLGKDTAVLHVKDYIVQEGRIVSARLGEGRMDFSEILTYVKEKKPHIHISLEETKPENAKQGREWLQNIGHSNEH